MRASLLLADRTTMDAPLSVRLIREDAARSVRRRPGSRRRRATEPTLRSPPGNAPLSPGARGSEAAPRGLLFARTPRCHEDHHLEAGGSRRVRPRGLGPGIHGERAMRWPLVRRVRVLRAPEPCRLDAG